VEAGMAGQPAESGRRIVGGEVDTVRMLVEEVVVAAER